LRRFEWVEGGFHRSEKRTVFFIVASPAEALLLKGITCALASVDFMSQAPVPAT
jgi:hypothetical protein